MLFGSLESKTAEIFANGEGLLDKMFKESGYSIVDAICGTDEETATLIIGYVSLYKSAKELAVMQAKVMDEMLLNLNELKDMNKSLRKQNKEMQDNLRQIVKDVEFLKMR